MNKITIILYITLLLSGCIETRIHLSDNQLDFLAQIKKAYDAKDVIIEEIKDVNSNSILENSIQINIVNSSKLRVNHPDVNPQCERVFIEFVKTFQYGQAFEHVRVTFSDKNNSIIYSESQSNGNTFTKADVDNILAQLNSPQYILEQTYIECERVDNYINLLTCSNEIIDKYPEFKDAIKYRGLANYKLGEIETAEKDFLYSRSLDKTDADIPMNLAIVYGDMELYEVGLNYIDTVLTIDSDYPKAFYYSGMYKYHLGDKKNGISDLEKAEN